MQYLSHTQAVGGRTIGFHICNGGRLPAPGTVDKEFCVNAEQLVEHPHPADKCSNGLQTLFADPEWIYKNPDVLTQSYYSLLCNMAEDRYLRPYSLHSISLLVVSRHNLFQKRHIEGMRLAYSANEFPCICPAVLIQADIRS